MKIPGKILVAVVAGAIIFTAGFVSGRGVFQLAERPVVLKSDYQLDDGNYFFAESQRKAPFVGTLRSGSEVLVCGKGRARYLTITTVIDDRFDANVSERH